MLARERIEYFLDPGSFHELDLLARHRAHAAGLEERPYTDGVITGWGTVDGRKVFVFSQDFTVFGGALGEVFAEKIHKLMDLALKVGAPVIGLNDGAGARIQEGVVSPRQLRRHLLPQRAVAAASSRRSRVILGPCAGGAVYSPAMTDFIFMVRETQPHVHHRPRRGEDGHRRGGHARRARRRDEPRVARAASPRSSAPTRRPASRTSASCSASCRRTTSRSRRRVETGDDPDRLCPTLHDDPAAVARTSRTT